MRNLMKIGHIILAWCLFRKGAGNMRNFLKIVCIISEVVVFMLRAPIVECGYHILICSTVSVDRGVLKETVCVFCCQFAYTECA